MTGQWQPAAQGELAQLRRENAEMKQVLAELAGLGLNGHGEAISPEVAAKITDQGISEWMRLQARRWASRQAAAQGWHEPPTAGAGGHDEDGKFVPGGLAAELAEPRQNQAPHRIPGLAGWNHNILLSGPRKLGKSQLAMNLTAALSLSAAWTAQQGCWTPAPFLGTSQCWAGGAVAYVDAEMDRDDWLGTFRALPLGSYDASRIHPLHCRGLPLPVITSEAARAWFTGWLRERHTELLIIDTWGALCAKNGVRNLNDDGEVRPVLDGLDQIKRDAGVASLLVLIHTPHQVPGMKHLERFKGAGAVGDWADVLWSYVADDDEDIRYLSAIGRARIELPERSLSFDHQTGLLSWGMTGSRAQTAAERQRQAMVGALSAAGAEGMLTGDLMEAAGGHTDTARKMAHAMAGRGEVVKLEKGRAVRWWLAGSQPVSVQDS